MVGGARLMMLVVVTVVVAVVAAVVVMVVTVDVAHLGDPSTEVHMISLGFWLSVFKVIGEVSNLGFFSHYTVIVSGLPSSASWQDLKVQI